MNRERREEAKSVKRIASASRITRLGIDTESGKEGIERSSYGEKKDKFSQKKGENREKKIVGQLTASRAIAFFNKLEDLTARLKERSRFLPIQQVRVIERIRIRGGLRRKKAEGGFRGLTQRGKGKEILRRRGLL